MREVMRWHYKRQDGHIVGYVRRLEDDTAKQVIPYFNPDNGSGIPDDFQSRDRVFGLDTVSDFNQPILIVEGEKCAVALHGIGYQAVTSLGGCNQVSLADWNVLDGATEIYLLPDNDDAGETYARTIYQQIRNFQSLKIIRALRFPIKPKADVCDYLASLEGLSDWDQLTPLHDHPNRAPAKRAFDAYLQSNLEPAPSAWRYIITPHKHKLISANDFSEITLPKRDKILAPWLNEGSINMIFADRGIGKTFFGLSCAIAMANGSNFLSYTASCPVPVLYLDGEMQATSMQHRLKLLTKGNRTVAPFHLFTPDCQDLTDHIPDVGEASGRGEIDALIDSVKPKAVFIDNISTFVRTGYENEADSWAPVQEWAVQLRKRGIAVIFIHHANKEGKQRGSHKKEDVMDVVIQLKRPTDFLQGTDDTRITVHYTKSRHLNAADTPDIEATLKDVDGSLEWVWEAGDLDSKRAMLLLQGGASMSEVAEEFGVSKSTISRWKTKANGSSSI